MVKGHLLTGKTMDGTRLTTLVALGVLVVAILSMQNGIPDVNLFSDTLLWVLAGLFIFHVSGGKCCRSRCREAAAPEDQ